MPVHDRGNDFILETEVRLLPLTLKHGSGEDLNITGDRTFFRRSISPEGERIANF